MYSFGIVMSKTRQIWGISYLRPAYKSQIGFKSSNFQHVWLWNFHGWPRKYNRALLLYYVKLCVSFQIHRWIQRGVTVRKRSIRFEIGDILARVTLKFDWWPWKTIGHLFYTTLSFVYHIKAMGGFNLELQCRNAQFGSKSAIFCPMCPWSLMDDLEIQ